MRIGPENAPPVLVSTTFTDLAVSPLAAEVTGQTRTDLEEKSVPTFGLGKDTSASIEIDWPSGAKQSIGRVASDQFLTIDENRGIIARQPPAKPEQ